MATIGCRNLKMWAMTSLTAETYDLTGRSFPVVKSIDITPSTWETSNVANDIVVDSATGFSKIEVAINTSDLSPEDYGWLFGATKDNKGVYNFGANDEVKTVAIAFQAEKSDQKNSRYTVLYKGKFQLPKETYNTKAENGVTYGDKQITGVFFARVRDEKYKAQVDSDDTEASQAVADWFKVPYGETVTP